MVEESSDPDSQPFYLDGVKFLHRVMPGDFSGKLTAFTYPDEFEEVVGSSEVAPGMYYHKQPPKQFHLSYRTRIGNDLWGENYAYKLHVLYNLFATPDTVAYSSLSDNAQATDLTWNLTGTPPSSEAHRPTVHISIDSRYADPGVLSTIEDILYGTAFTNPRMPGIDELTDLMAMFGALVIVDNGDGTWTAIDLADQYIVMDSPTQFTINNANATYSDPDTYQVSTTTP